MRILRNVILLLLPVLLACCTITFDAHGPFLGSGNYNKVEVLSEESIEAEACVNTYLFFVPLGEATPNAAFQKAMLIAPAGTTGLSNAEIELIERWFLVLHQKCISISGKPSRRTAE